MKYCKSILSFLIVSGCILETVPALAELPCSSFVIPENENALNLPELIDEISGMVVSRSNPEYLWGHTDSKGEPELYLFNRSGEVLRTYRLRDTSNVDWEDLAIGPCAPWSEQNCLYIADTGDNLYKRKDKRIVAVVEPDVSEVTTASSTAIKIDILHTWRLHYPESTAAPVLSNPDAESMMVRPGSGEIYIVSKHSEGGKQTLYQMTRGGEEAGNLTALATYKFSSTDSPLYFLLQELLNATTSADFSPDGYHFAVRTYGYIYEYDLLAYPEMATAFKHPVERFLSKEVQGESVAYDADGKSIITSGEYKPGVNPATMNFFACVDNEDYTAPDPIMPPDPLPEYEPEPDPIYGCMSEDSYHEWNDSCEVDSVYHCGSHTVNCKKTIKNWYDGVCSSQKCVVTDCKEDLVPSDTGDSCVEPPPVDPGEDPVNPGEDPVNPGEDPVNPGEDPVNPGEDPVNPGEDPVNPGGDPVNPGDDPEQPGGTTQSPTQPKDSDSGHDSCSALVMQASVSWGMGGWILLGLCGLFGLKRRRNEKGERSI